MYLDTSYIVKAYLREPGTPAILRLLAGRTDLSSCAHARVELYSAITRQQRDGHLAPRAAQKAIASFEQDCQAGRWFWWPMDENLIRETCLRLQSIGAVSPARTLDALHLTCAAMHGFEEIHSHDRHMIAAAPSFGLTGIDIIED
ncbi:MAG: hypothetical protein CMO74_10780 [Verrucomicrobiales bacterium]|nr:hypothetical protein [Verrucomicrobiales bacterium]|tara:strand:+ start:999 stop:1433 length:435 start_codon:yes stop_codon:yes gene_type:complete